jgi:hypothetical protein
MQYLALLTVVSVFGVLGLQASPASAATGEGDEISPNSCPEVGWHYRVFNKQDLHIPAGLHYKSGPGGTVSATVQHNLSATLGTSINTSVNGSLVVASAGVTFGINASVTSSISQTYTYSRNIAAGKYGNVQFGNWGWRMGLEKYYLASGCTVTSSYTGTVTKMPSAGSWGYRYWETNS